MKTSLLALSVCLVTLRLTAAAAEDSGYVAHEWGTFTSVQGADGVQLGWNPLIVSELPKFVYDRSRLRNGDGRVLLTKSAAGVFRQRLETPVIYFHSDRPRTVDVAVSFPQGTVTEWFPRDTPAAKYLTPAPALRWGKVGIVPRASRAAKRLDAVLPREPRGSHYYAARGADSDYVQVTAGKGTTETEKFLFYRGVGNFEAPLKVTLPGKDDGVLRLENTGKNELRDLFLCLVRDGRVTSIPVEKLAAGATRELGVQPSTQDMREELATQLHHALTRAGLFVSEAAAMVKTWEDSWLSESGMRVLYVLPASWADTVLPLKLEPAPKAISRVMVGRAEVISPMQEIALAGEVRRFASGDPDVRAEAVAAGRALGLGRFMEAAMRRVIAADPQDRGFSNAGWDFLNAAFKAEAAPAATTAQATVRR